MAKTETSDEVFDSSIKRWTQSPSFIDAFTRRTLNSPRFTQIVADFAKSHKETTAE